MAKAKLPQNLAKNASKLHKAVGVLLDDGLFACWQVRQEYPVNKVNKSFKSGREKFDWVILGLKVVIEAHGEQHYKPVCFGGITGDEARRNFRKRLEVDFEKETAAREAGWAYVVVKYTEKRLTAQDLRSKILNAIEEIDPTVAEVVPAKPKAKIPHPKEHKWPTRKIPSRKFQ